MIQLSPNFGESRLILPPHPSNEGLKMKARRQVNSSVGNLQSITDQLMSMEVDVPSLLSPMNQMMKTQNLFSDRIRQSSIPIEDRLEMDKLKKHMK